MVFRPPPISKNFGSATVVTRLIQRELVFQP